MALSDKSGTASFFVPATVEGTEKGWEHMKGYSSGGRLVSAAKPSDTRYIMVSTERIDDIVDREVDFAKIDVQGGELSVLRGASRLAQKAMIKCLYTEYDGNDDLIQWLDDNGFVLTNDLFLVCPLSDEADLSEWDIVRTIDMSNGTKGYYGWPKSHFLDLSSFAEFVRRKRPNIRAVQTDIFCMHRNHAPEILSAMSRQMF